MSRDRYKFFDNNRPYFVTCTVVQWLPLFSSPPIVQFILDSLTFMQQNGRLIVFAYVILENHLHLVAASENLSKEIGDFKSYTARCIIDYLEEKNSNNILKMLHYHKLKHKKDRKYQLWQEGSHPKQILSVEMMRQKIEYIHNNPVKRGYVDEQVAWRYSSARNYAGKEGLIEVTTEW